MRTWVTWIVSALLCVASISGCDEGAVSEEELGEPIAEISDVPGSDEPYDLDQLSPKEGGAVSPNGE